ncbi:tRNA (guanine(37)-N1)-methyltransferase [Thrips palmi]|uniref:tRNA (guanine(37)-N1)-methyltransferase n=1 Tax=Thrips palmi TaxID=161013 RepID=A0A6P8ZWV4_THRPL|nr:tRNA (guanine(37)-N1)-methyltransferase [Thrips palmi]
MRRGVIKSIQTAIAGLFQSFAVGSNCLSMTMLSLQDCVLEKDLLLPPSSVNGMKILDREKFSKSIYVPYLLVSKENIPNTLKVTKKYLLKMPNLNPVQTIEGSSDKKIILDPFKLMDCLASDEKEKLGGLKDNDFKMCEIILSYENWLAEGILKTVLPQDQEGVSSWSTIGHIIHVNLRDHLLDYKHLIGQVLLDKNKQARSVVNKANSIDSTFRTFQIELLAGDENMLTQVKENHCKFEFDFSKVYWNPRLVGEHERVVNEIDSGSILYDVFAGVGPFAVPAAKKKCRVLANDLNPESFKWLQHNVKSNKVSDRVTVFNKDGADFIRSDIKADLEKYWSGDNHKPCHITMNLPAMAVEFLKNFKFLFLESEKPSTFISPIVHVYCFIKNAEDSSKAAQELVEHHLGTELNENLKKVFLVRTVSNNKDMMRVSFSLPENILFGNDSDEPATKKVCIRDGSEQN